MTRDGALGSGAEGIHPVGVAGVVGGVGHASGGDRTSQRWLLISFAGLGATAATLPAAIPAMAETLGAPVAALTPAVPALFLGVLGGVLAAPLSALRFSPGTTVRVGSVLQAAGLVLAATAGSPGWFVAGAAAAGLGFGLVEVSGSASTHSVEPSAAPRLLLRLTLLVAIVATLTPVLVLGASALGVVRIVPLLAAVLQLAAAAWPRPVLAPSRRPAAVADRRPRPAGENRDRRVLARLAVLALAVFCYVGVETVLSGWSAAAISVEFGTGAGVAALGTSAFWLLISLGRLSGAAVDRRVAPAVVVIVATAGLAVAMGAAALTRDADAAASVVLSGVAVFFAGPCYALLLGTGLGMVPAARAVPLTSTLVVLGAAGGAAVPLLATALAGGTGRPPLAVAAVAAAVLLAAVLIVGALGRSRGRPSGPATDRPSGRSTGPTTDRSAA
jgi:fucose permease